jgi:hypothetical protein
MPRQTLDEILSDDSDLLNVKSGGNVASTEHQRVIDSLEEINRFIDRFNRKPGETDKPTVSERGLQIKLNGLRKDASLRNVLVPHDRHGLLPAQEPAAPKTLDDILDDDDLLSTPQDDIFDLVHVRPPTARPDEVAERQVCKDFDRFKPFFEQCVRELSEGKRKAITFANEQEVEAGEFFILNGVMVYVAEVGETHIRNGKKNARLRLIFDNGTEGNNLLPIPTISPGCTDLISPRIPR